MKSSTISVLIYGEYHYFTYEFHAQSDYGQMAEVKMGDKRMYVDENLSPFMTSIPEDWIGPIICKLKEVIN
ncbi:hypothetical protein BFS30_24780 [Pedobacter steynii]|uniref:Uncharacterized protein n=1 Tax=Pedobacter steynii TaxID=430522 RepID=A0A1D7QN67_9SPHI|nr:hypothetical protein BFS30_24780 [Pedobacter steynii]